MKLFQHLWESFGPLPKPSTKPIPSKTKFLNTVDRDTQARVAVGKMSVKGKNSSRAPRELTWTFVKRRLRGTVNLLQLRVTPGIWWGFFGAWKKDEKKTDVSKILRIVVTLLLRKCRFFGQKTVGSIDIQWLGPKFAGEDFQPLCFAKKQVSFQRGTSNVLM